MRRLVVYCDCKAVIVRNGRVTTGCCRGTAEVMWRRVRELTAEDTTLVWVPSHEERVGWQPEQGPLSAEKARALNARADKYASEVLQVHKREHDEGLARRAAAAAWSKRAVEVQVEKTRDFHATWCVWCKLRLLRVRPVDQLHRRQREERMLQALRKRWSSACT